MFDHILVADELIPVREQASRGDFDAMYQLTEHILNAKHTVRTSAYAEAVIGAMFDHSDFRKDLQKFCNTYVMMTTVLRMQYQEGKISYRHYIETSCYYMELMIGCMTSAPRRMWNYRQLINCLDWMAEHESALEKEATT